MKILAISGSGRAASTNTSMLQALSATALPGIEIVVFDRISDLPVFSPDLEALTLPEPVQNFADLIRDSDGIIIASPEYVRAIPGGLKNAIDWLVSRDEIIEKPMALMHASHRGDDMLEQLRLVLSTISTRFSADIFLQFDLMKQSPEEILDVLQLPQHRREMAAYLETFTKFCSQ